MNPIRKRTELDDRGSIVVALLGIIILSTVATAGLATVVTGQHQSRHDNTFTQALNNAETGLDSMVANVKAIPANTTAPQNLSLAGVYTATATAVATYDATGAPASTVWTIKSSGTSTPPQGLAVTRAVQETITIMHVSYVPLYGQNNLSIGQGSAVYDYQFNNQQAVSPQQIASVLGLLPTYVNLPQGANVTPGAAAGDGDISINHNDISNFAQIGRDNAGGACADAITCANSIVVTGATPPPVVQPPCPTGLVGVNIDGLPVALPLGLTFNDSISTQYLAAGVIPQTFCSSLPIVIPSVGALNLLNDPLNSKCTGVAIGTCTMNNPTLLNIYGVGGATITIGTDLAPISNDVTVLSGNISDPSGNCVINGNVILFGAINCKTITQGPDGGSIKVYYPTDVGLNDDITQHTDTVTNWNECVPATSASCKP